MKYAHLLFDTSLVIHLNFLKPIIFQNSLLSINPPESQLPPSVIMKTQISTSPNRVYLNKVTGFPTPNKIINQFQNLFNTWVSMRNSNFSKIWFKKVTYLSIWAIYFQGKISKPMKTLSNRKFSLESNQ